MRFCFNGLKRSLITAGERLIVLPHPFPNLTCQESRTMQLWAYRAGWESHALLQSPLSVAGLCVWSFSFYNMVCILREALERTCMDLDLAALSSYEHRMKGCSLAWRVHWFCAQVYSFLYLGTSLFRVASLPFHHSSTSFLRNWSSVNPIYVFLASCNLVSLTSDISPFPSFLSALFSSGSHHLYLLCCPSIYRVRTRGREKYLEPERQRMGLNAVTELRDRRLWQTWTKKSRLVEKKIMLVKEEAGYRNFLYQRKGRSWWEQYKEGRKWLFGLVGELTVAVDERRSWARLCAISRAISLGSGGLQERQNQASQPQRRARQGKTHT